jgi:hypothetical protein
MELNEGLVVANLGNEIKIIGDEEGDIFPNDVINVLKYICKNFANYIFADNIFIQYIHNEIRKSRVNNGRKTLSNDIHELAPYFNNDPDLTVFSVLDGEDLNEYE